MNKVNIEKAAAALYNAGLPYHNFEHVKDTLQASEKIIRQCQQEGIDVDEEVVYYALLFHDAGYHEDHLQKGLTSKEAYSAKLAGDVLSGFHFSQPVIAKIQQAILATHMHARCLSNEDKAVRAADLDGLAADYTVFKSNAIKLRKEAEYLTGAVLPWEEYTRQVSHILNEFLKEELKLTKDYYDECGKSLFHQKAQANISRLLSDTPD